MKHFALILLAVFVSEYGFSAVRNELSKESLLIELTGKDYSKISDSQLYAELIASYQASNEVGFQSRLQRFMSQYPQSPFADNALYVAGKMALEAKNYPQSIRYFQRVQQEYPRSNRLVSSMFAKARAYRQMNLIEQSRNSFKDVIKKFPGSPEAFQAESELRLMGTL